MERFRSPALIVSILFPLLALLVLEIAPRPLAADAAMQKAQQALTDGNPQAAQANFQTAAAYYPWRADLWEQAGIAAQQAGEADQAISDLKQAAGIGPLSPAGAMALGDTYQKKGDLKSAVQVWRGALAEDGASTQIYQRLAAADQSSQDLPGQIADLRAWLAAAPQDAQVMYRLGLALLVGHPQEALPLLVKAEGLDSSLSAAVKTLQAGANAGGSSEDPAYRLLLVGRALGAVDEWALAEAAFQGAVRANPSYAEAWAFLGEAEQQLGGSGETELQRALQLSPDSVLVQALQALYWLRQSKPEMALVYLHAAAEQEPSNPTWQVELGNALVSLGDLNSALGYFQQATQLAPQNPDYWRALADFSLHYAVQVHDVGLPAARQAAALAPNDPANQDLMGEIMLALNDFSNAERFLLKAVQTDPNYAPAHLHLGLLYQQQNRMAEAQSQFTQTVALSPDSPEGEQASRLLKRYFP